MSSQPLVERADLVAILAALGDRRPESVGEELGSLELAWLVAQAEERYGLVLDLTEEELYRLSTVTGAVELLREVQAGVRLP